MAFEWKDAGVEDGAYTPSNSASLVRFVLRVGGAHLPPLSFARSFFWMPSPGHSASFIVVLLAQRTTAVGLGVFHRTHLDGEATELHHPI